VSLLAAIVLAIVASTSPLPSGSPAPIPLDRPFVVAHGGSAIVEGDLWVHFLAVSEDSRCPSDVVCVWEGNARVGLELQASGAEPAHLSLDTNPGFTTEATYASYTIGLLALKPYPQSERPMDEPYRATLVVSATPAVGELSPVPSSASTVPAPNASPIPAPSAPPSLAAITSTEPAPAAIATLLMYSGVPDPSWSLTQAHLDELAAVAAGLDTTDVALPEGGLGYRGFRVSGPQGTWRANGGVVLTPDSAPGTARSDPQRLVERFLLSSAADAMTADEAAIAAAAIEASAIPAPG
jgi:hypothetical protein